VASGHCSDSTDEQAFVAGVVFRPGGTVPFVAPPALELSDANVPLEALGGRQRARLLREHLLSAPDPQSTLDVLEAALLDRRREKAAHPYGHRNAGVADRNGITW
jgi:hypothetical protein